MDKGYKVRIKDNNITNVILLIILLHFLFIPNLEAQPQTLKLKVTTEQANIRLKPDISSIIIQQVPLGTILESTGRTGEWYRVKIKTTESATAFGYVHESLVVVISPRPTPEKKQKEQRPPKKIVPEKKPTPSPVYLTTQEYQLDLSFFGGGNYILGGDLNEGAKGLAAYYSDSLAIEETGEVKPLRLSYIFSGEVSYPLSSYFSLGLGLGYFSGDKESRVEFQSPAATDVFLTKPKVRVVPLKVFLTFYPLSSFYLKAGAEYYFGRCSYYYRYQSQESWQEWTGEAKSQGLGLWAGIGLEWPLLSHLSFTVEGAGRYAQLKGFKGKNTYKNSEGESFSEEGQLYFYQKIRIVGQAGYPQLFIHKKKPAAYVSNLRKAVVDLSGFNLKFGFKIRF
ncbi:MAG: SH3 domain-containing protein [Candidatus Aminicenantales bacterium]